MERDAVALEADDQVLAAACPQGVREDGPATSMPQLERRPEIGDPGLPLPLPKQNPALLQEQLRAATDPNAKGGEFYGPRWGNNGAPTRKPILRRDIDEGIEKLWLVSERATGATLDFDAATDKS